MIPYCPGGPMSCQSTPVRPWSLQDMGPHDSLLPAGPMSCQSAL
ncbi:unnamed protein product, partial [Staurois parvus]